MIIFDLDGTLADCEHRRHFVDPAKRSDCYYFDRNDLHQGPGWYYKDKGDRTFEKHFQPNWQAFYEACDKDKPIQQVCDLFRELNGEFEISIWSGRCESLKDITEHWLIQNVYGFSKKNQLKMRPIGDNTPEDQLKERWLFDIVKIDSEHRPPGIKFKHNINFVFDADPKSIAMWHLRGIYVFDCNQTRKEF